MHFQQYDVTFILGVSSHSTSSVRFLSQLFRFPLCGQGAVERHHVVRRQLLYLAIAFTINRPRLGNSGFRLAGSCRC